MYLVKQKQQTFVGCVNVNGQCLVEPFLAAITADSSGISHYQLCTSGS